MDTLDITTTAACVLGLLELGRPPWMAGSGSADEMTGWQIYEAAVDSISRFWNITRSQIYLELARLAEAGLVAAGEERGPRESRPYHITDAGRQAFRSWLAAWANADPRDEQLRSPLVLLVFFGDYLPPATLVRTLQEYRLRHQRRVERLRAMQAAIGEDRSLATATVRRGMAYQELMVRWIDSILEDLARL
jgi:DNA-binding PadR family transcriptional regulator